MGFWSEADQPLAGTGLLIESLTDQKICLNIYFLLCRYSLVSLYHLTEIPYLTFMKNWILIVIASLSFIQCTEDLEIGEIPDVLEQCDTEAALATCLSPQFPPEYYIEQGVKYFQTMQSDIPIDVIPNYSDLVIRWEWPPWLLLTGFTRGNMIWTDILLKLNPTTYDLIDCRFFEEQPFCRCHVIFNYSGEQCPIYEEFIFNDQGEITFIEAWSDFPSLIPMDPDDYWAEGDNVNRLGTRVPGLGNETGRIDLNADWMNEAAENDPILKEMIRRCKDPGKTWLAELITHSEELAGGCHPPEGDSYPYYWH